MIAHVNESEPAVAEVIMGQTTKTENADKEQTPVGDDRFAEATSAATDSTFGTAGCCAPAIRPFCSVLVLPGANVVNFYEKNR